MENETEVVIDKVPEQINVPAPILIGKDQIRKAVETLKDYKKGKTNLETRIVENEQWYKIRHWEQTKGEKNTNDPEPTSAWLFNSIANKHADAMDNYPEPSVLPREASDKNDAKILSDIIPVVLERNEFEQTYNDVWWYKLKTGTGIYGVFWNNELENGLGDIDIKQIDIINIFWEPGIKDIQKSRNIFTVELVDNEVLADMYPQLKDKLSSPSIDLAEYQYDDTVDTTKKSAVVDWYYKKTLVNPETGMKKKVLHYCKFVNDEVLFATENDQNFAERGFYDHAEYPFVFDTLFIEEGTPVGFGYVDIAKDPQMYIDKLNQLIMKNAYWAGNPRALISDDAGINEDEFKDFTKPFIHHTGMIDERTFKLLSVPSMDGFITQHLQSRIDELKETSGNRDFSQGGTASGVTAASAIAALQEAGSKLSRDMIKSSYRAHKKICIYCIELIRQFYTEPRQFRITGQQGEEQFSRAVGRSAAASSSACT
jgi:hypothetical protein